MHTYQDLLRVREFRALFLGNCATVAGMTMSGLALATLVQERTGSPLLTALSLFGAAFASVVGSMTLMSAADGLAPRRGLSLLAAVSALAACVQAIPGLPVGWRIGVVVGVGYLFSIGGGLRWGLLGDLLPAESYVLGRSLMNASVGAMQIAGFGLGGLLLQWLSPTQIFATSAALAVTAAVVLRFGLRERPARSDHRPGLRRTWVVNRQLLADPSRRALYLAMWIPNGLVVGAEALFVPYAGHSAGLLFVAGAIGMLAADVGVGRFLKAHWRVRLAQPLQVLLAVPYLVLFFKPGLPLVAVLVLIASVGFGASLLLQERLVELTAPEVRGQALGLHSAGQSTMQGVAAVIAGLIGEVLAINLAMAVMAVLSLLITAGLTRGVQRAIQAGRADTSAELVHTVT
ncbi:MFS transporter [Kribbella sp. NPDC056861]|uniref:MFS transporter n=1 Tax=Kribbella sp. NPDC056861 TaxID=3154857 RepID=UPI00341E5B24